MVDESFAPARALPPEAQVFIADVLRRHRDALGENLVGLYGFGSLALGDFDPASSDLDLLAVTRTELQAADLSALRSVHEAIKRTGGPWAPRLEMLYLPVGELREATRTGSARTAYMSPDTPLTDFVGFDVSWILNCHMARDGGVAFAGPAPATLIPAVPPERIREVVGELLRNEWAKAVEGPDWMRSRRHQAFAVLTMCRALYALRTGELPTKPRAAAWALGALDPRWHGVIRRAIDTRSETSQEPAMGELPETLAFLRFAVSTATSGRPG